MKGNPLSVLPVLLLGAALLPALLVQVLADVISPGTYMLSELGRRLPLILVVAVLVLTAWLVRKFTKKK